MSLLRREKTFSGEEAAKVCTVVDPGPAAVKAAFRASVVGGGRFARSEMGFGKKVNRRNSMSMLEPGPMAWQSLKSLDSFLEDAKEEKLKPKLRVRDDSVDDFFSVVKSSVRLQKGNSMWSLHASKTSIETFGKVLDKCNQILKDIFSQIPPEKLSEEVHTVFLRLDKDGTGELDEEELGDAFDQFGLQLNAEEVRGLMEKYDASCSGTLDSFEFEHMVRIMLAKPCVQNCPACVDPKFRNTTEEDSPSPPPEESPEESGSPSATAGRGAGLLAQMQAEVDAEAEAEADARLAVEREVQREVQRVRAEEKEAERLVDEERMKAERAVERKLLEEQWRIEDARAIAGMQRDLQAEALHRSESREGDPAYLQAHPERAPRMAGLVRRLGRRMSDGGALLEAASSSKEAHSSEAFKGHRTTLPAPAPGADGAGVTPPRSPLRA
eukprot:CAMPEP_0180349428 /NCGR_PEP_ID=MMETSP0989-20121125/5457_1 /TAXON_ID=697907 /ORGANISM="non described non described, Strain CCMP2293" /LENGTH=439 /DNA_ID=CAMNT_0022338737 /DNA_START=42 /DNA_END=1358 /DNA_ORIENTATION=-